MKNFRIRIYNNIAAKGLDKFPASQYAVSQDDADPDAILCRSQDLHALTPGERLKAVGRAGAGVNNIPVEALNAHGIMVFRTPGANANAVKELVLAGLLIASRNLCDAWLQTKSIARQYRDQESQLANAVEASKKEFAGVELPGRVMGVIGLGAIGRSVAEACLDLGMRVVGYDPQLTVEGAWRLSSAVERATSINEVVRHAHVVSMHVPLNDDTQDMINASVLQAAKPGLTLLNFAREGIVDEGAVIAALDGGRIGKYVTDFPSGVLVEHEQVIAFPHLGASTVEAEENCAEMVVDLVRDYLENGNIRNAVNFPDAFMPRGSEYRLCVVNRNVPNMLGQISTTLGAADLNICDMLNKSQGELAYTIVDSDSPIPEAALAHIGALEGVLDARLV